MNAPAFGWDTPTITWEIVKRFDVLGIPKGQPRGRSFVRQAKGRTMSGIYDPGTADDWKARIISEAFRVLPVSPLTGPVRVDIDLFFPRPKRLCRKADPDGPVLHTAKPDRDNSDKCVLDALTQVGFFADDAQVCGGEVRKWYHGKDGRAGARVVVSIIPAVHIP